MRRPLSTSRSAFSVGSVIAFVAVSIHPTRAGAQACCAGAAAVTPGRLAVHEDALVGFQSRAADIFASFSKDADYVPASAAEWDFEQDLFGALRVARRAQVALLAPVVQTYRRARGISDFGGGLGDLNLSGRYDFTLAGESEVVPGVGALVGVTFPTGRPTESSDAANHPLAADATGTGAYQLNLGLALEQTVGPWLFGVTGLYSKRTPRTIGGTKVTLGAQWTVLAGAAYTFSNDAALALVASYSAEGNTEADGIEVPMSSRRIPLLTLAGLYPLNDPWRLQGGVFATPPLSSLGRNTPANLGLVLALVRSWS